VAFHTLSRKSPGDVYVRDELDWSLHPHLAPEGLAFFLDGRTLESRSQLPETTHHATLMDRERLRGDEICLAENNGAGATVLRYLGKLKDLRFGTKLRRNYVNGRFSGAPSVKHRPRFRAGIHQIIWPHKNIPLSGALSRSNPQNPGAACVGGGEDQGDLLRDVATSLSRGRDGAGLRRASQRKQPDTGPESAPVIPKVNEPYLQCCTLLGQLPVSTVLGVKPS
jgi:hypothetical protein